MDSKQGNHVEQSGSVKPDGSPRSDESPQSEKPESAKPGSAKPKSAKPESANPESVQAQSKVGKAAGSSLPLLPGESAELYIRSFEATIMELGAKTELQIYLAEKIFVSIWWMRRYENQKRACIIKGMVDAHIGPYGDSALKVVLTNLFHSGTFESPKLIEMLANKGHTPQSLLEESMRRHAKELQALDEQIALRTKTMMGLQQSYEALVNRSVIRERLKLQNEILKRDLQAIDLKLAPQLEDSNDKRPPKSRT